MEQFERYSKLLLPIVIKHCKHIKFINQHMLVNFNNFILECPSLPNIIFDGLPKNVVVFQPNFKNHVIHIKLMDINIQKHSKYIDTNFH